MTILGFSFIKKYFDMHLKAISVFIFIFNIFLGLIMFLLTNYYLEVDFTEQFASVAVDFIKIRLLFSIQIFKSLLNKNTR